MGLMPQQRAEETLDTSWDDRPAGVWAGRFYIVLNDASRGLKNSKSSEHNANLMPYN